MPRSIQPSLTGGEISPALHSRVDIARYSTSLATCRNFFVHSHGGVSNRSGFEYVGVAPDHNRACRLIPFEFNTEQTYILVMGHQKMQVIRDGGLILEPSQNITNITAADPAVVTITGHLYSNGDQVYVTDTGVALLDNKYHTIANVTANTFEISVDGTGWSSGGTASRLFELATPYDEGDLFNIRYVQSADVMTFTHPSYAPRELTRTDHHVWTLSTISFASSMSVPTNLTASEAGGGSTGDPKSYQYVVTSCTNEGDESQPSAAASFTTSTYPLGESKYGNLDWDQMSGADYYNVYKEHPYNSGIYGFIGEADDGASPSFNDYNFLPDTTKTPPIANNPFNASDDYPQCATYHQQRLFFGATNNNPQTIWGTKSSNFDNMDGSRPSRPDDGFDFTINSTQVNEIRHMISLDTLVVFTSGGIWRIDADQDGVITPSNIYPRKQIDRGCSNLPPIVIGETALYVQAQGSRVRDLSYTFESDKYSGQDLSIMAEHLFYSYTVSDWCYSEEPYSLVWAVRSDGTLLSLAYLKEHQVWGWSRHDTDGTFESVASIAEDDESAVYAVVNRTVGGSTVRYIERLKERRFTDIRDAFFVDSGLTYTGPTHSITGATAADPVVITASGHGRSNGDVVWLSDIAGMTELNARRYKVANVTAGTYELQDLDGNDIDGTGYTAYTSGGTGQLALNIISGLDHLEGKDVSVLADGNVVNDLTVASGSITLPDYASVVHVGLGYNSDVQTLDINYTGEVVQTRKKAVDRLGMMVRDTRGLQAGIDENSLYEIKERTVRDAYGSITALTGQQIHRLSGNWTDGARVFVRQSNPLPATILAFIPEVDVSA